jgi:hypothetical protein
MEKVGLMANPLRMGVGVLGAVARNNPFGRMIEEVMHAQDCFCIAMATFGLHAGERSDLEI